MTSNQGLKLTSQKYHLEATPLIPNSPHPLLHYPSILLTGYPGSPIKTSPAPLPVANTIALRAQNLFDINKWEPQWIYRYGPTQQAHYHSRVHECMVVLCGEASVTFGAADSEIDAGNQESLTGRSDHVGVTLAARAGDVFVIPAGVAHKTHSVTAGSTFALLTSGDGHGIVGEDGKASKSELRDILSGVELTGFAMLGAYPALSSEEWDFAIGGEDVGEYEKVWNVTIPERDPVYGTGEAGLTRSWA